jgi:outer membrane protein assembly factor BamA
MKKLCVVFFLSFTILLAQSDSSKSESKIDGLPILMYDSDVGFGYGAKVFLLNQLKTNESFDFVLFNSTKGERWYRFVFSLPDFELRQGKIYPWAFDLIVDYDKMIKNNFFGIGNGSKYESREIYTKEPLEVSFTLSRGFTESFVGQISLKYKSIRNYDFDEAGKLQNLSSSLNPSEAYYSSAIASLRYDTRDSFINPSSGFVLNGEIESANKSFNSNFSFLRWSALFQYYLIIWRPKSVFAFRIITENISGENLPIQLLLPIGGTKTLRGSPIDRFLDKSLFLLTAELRFPLYKRLGGLLAFDAGKVFSSFNKLEIGNWSANPTFGLRFYMDTFIVRLDVGLGKETTGLYFNFGHLF